MTKKEKKAEYDKAYRAKNRDKLKAQIYAWRAAHKGRCNQRAKEYKLKNPKLYAAIKKRCDEKHREKRAAYAKAYRAKNRERLAAYDRKCDQESREKKNKQAKLRRIKNSEAIRTRDRKFYKHRTATNPQFVTATRLRNRLWAALTRASALKHHHTTELIGCSYAQLHDYLEARFLPGMTWENRSEWHIDHIRPCASFDLTDPEQQKTCFHYTNLQPLWAFDNLKKGARIVIEADPRHQTDTSEGQTGQIS